MIKKIAFVKNNIYTIMNKFSKLVENFTSKKYYKSTCKVDLIVQSETEGDAGNLMEQDLGALEYLSDFEMGDITEISKDEYKEKTLSESYLIKLGKTNESIMVSWENKFGDKKPSNVQVLEFYHLLRQSGHDKETILDTLKGRL
jgi:hypothetical protein